MHFPISTPFSYRDLWRDRKTGKALCPEAARRTTRALGARSLRSYVPLCCGPSESAAAKDTGLCLLYFITSTNPNLRTHILQYFFQRVLAACVTSDHICIASSCLFYRAAHHFMRYGVCKQYDQIRTSDLLTEARGHLCEYFCLTVESLTDLLILTYHSVMTTYNNNTHIKTSCRQTYRINIYSR